MWWPAGRWDTATSSSAGWWCGRTRRPRKWTEHRQRPVSHAEIGFGAAFADLAVMGQHRGPVHRGEPEFGHLQLVVQRAAFEASQRDRRRNPQAAEPPPRFQYPHIEQPVVHARAYRRREPRR